MRPILEGLISQREDFLNKDSDSEEEEPEEVVEEEPTEEEPEEEVIEGDPFGEELEEIDYASMTVSQLKKLLKEKGSPVSGKKADLIFRLEN